MHTAIFSSGCTLNVDAHINNDSRGVIIFISDNLGDSHQVFLDNPAIQKLSNMFSCVYYDNRGTGESSYPLLGKIGVGDLTDDLHCVVNYTKQTFKDQPVYLFTATYGSISALSYLQKYPNGVDKLIIDSPLLFLNCPGTLACKMASFKKNNNKLSHKPLATKINALDTSTQGMYDLLLSKELCEYVASNVTAPDEICFHYAMADVILGVDLRLHVDSLRVETLFLQGNKSKLIPAVILSNVVSAYKNRCVCLREFNDYTEHIYQNNPDEFYRICCEFLLG